MAIQYRRSSQRSISFIEIVAGRPMGKPICTFSRVPRACRERPGRRTAEERDKLAPLHVLPFLSSHATTSL